MRSSIGRVVGRLRDAAARLGRQSWLQKILLACGVGYGVAYIVANDVVAATMFDGYSRRDQAISELSGTEAPSRAFLGAMLPVFALLVVGFGVGVWRAAGQNRALRVTGGILIAQGVMFPLWLLFPMTSREALTQGTGGVNDIGHMVLSVLAVLFIVAQMGFSAAALGRRFRYFSIAMAVTALSAGALTAVLAPDVAAGEPTPWMGFVERISYGSWLLWMAVLSVALLRRPRGRHEAMQRPPAALPRAA